MEFRFMSREGESAYVVRSGVANHFDEFFHDPAAYISSAVGIYYTGGDGLTQHSPAQCASRERMVDFLLSLADFVIQQKVTPDNEILQSLYWEWPTVFRVPSEETIRFVLTLKYDPDKPMYFNLADRKKSRAESKRYDKRWREVPSWFDGSAESVLSLLCESFWGTLDRYAALRRIRELMGHPWVDYKAALGVDAEYCYGELHTAFGVVDRVVTAFSLVRDAVLAHQNIS